MTESMTFEEFDREVTAFQLRLQELRALRTLGEGGEEAAEAVFLELETAAEELRVAHEQLWTTGNELAQANAPEDRDRNLLRSVFRELPLPVILIDQEGRIRRLNQKAVELLGAGADYLSGKPFPVFIDPPQRAALRSHLAAVTRGSSHGTALLNTGLLRQGRSVPAQLLLSTIRVPADRRPVVVAVVVSADHPRPAPPSIDPADPGARPHNEQAEALQASVRRSDALVAVAELVIEEMGNSEAALVHALGRLLCRDFADWVIVDLLRDGQLTRAAVCGPGEPASTALAQALERAPVGTPELPCAVIGSGRSRLEAHVEDPTLLGDDDRGVPFLSAMGAHSVLSVAIAGQDRSQGAVTALRGRDRNPFSLSEQATLQDVARLLGQAVQTARRVERRTSLVRSPPATLTPRRLPTVPGLEVAFFHRSAEYDGDSAPGLVDVYPSRGGLGAVLGDVEIGGDHAVLTLSEVRHWARLLGLTGATPEVLLERLNTGLRRSGEDAPLVSLSALHVAVEAGRATVRLASAGQRSSAAVRADGRVQHADGGGQPLGGSDDVVVHADDSQLEPGDLIFCYNNALFDSRNSDGAGFGQSGQLGTALARAAGGTAQQVTDALSEALAAFTGGVIGPDVVALSVRFTGT